MSARDYGMILLGMMIAFTPSMVTFAIVLFRAVDPREEAETPRTLDELDRIVERVGVEMRRPT